MDHIQIKLIYLKVGKMIYMYIWECVCVKCKISVYCLWHNNHYMKWNNMPILISVDDLFSYSLESHIET